MSSPLMVFTNMEVDAPLNPALTLGSVDTEQLSTGDTNNNIGWNQSASSSHRFRDCSAYEQYAAVEHLPNSILPASLPPSSQEGNWWDNTSQTASNPTTFNDGDVSATIDPSSQRSSVLLGSNSAALEVPVHTQCLEAFISHPSLDSIPFSSVDETPASMPHSLQLRHGFHNILPLSGHLNARVTSHADTFLDPFTFQDANVSGNLDSSQAPVPTIYEPSFASQFGFLRSQKLPNLADDPNLRQLCLPETLEPSSAFPDSGYSFTSSDELSTIPSRAVLPGLQTTGLQSMPFSESMVSAPVFDSTPTSLDNTLKVKRDHVGTTRAATSHVHEHNNAPGKPHRPFDRYEASPFGSAKNRTIISLATSRIAKSPQQPTKHCASQRRQETLMTEKRCRERLVQGFKRLSAVLDLYRKQRSLKKPPKLAKADELDFASDCIEMLQAEVEQLQATLVERNSVLLDHQYVLNQLRDLIRDSFIPNTLEQPNPVDDP